MVISKRPPQDPHHLLNQALISTEVLVEPHIRYSTLGESETSFKLLFLFFFISVEFAFVCSNENKSTKFCDLSYEISCFCCQLFSVCASNTTYGEKQNLIHYPEVISSHFVKFDFGRSCDLRCRRCQSYKDFTT